MTMFLFDIKINMQTIKASVLKAKCLHLMDLVNQSGEEIIITKNGKPVSRLVPYRKQIDTLFGLHKGRIKSNDSLISPIDEEWNVEQ
jgi:prevent-host-death family protein